MPESVSVAPEARQCHPLFAVLGPPLLYNICEVYQRIFEEQTFSKRLKQSSPADPTFPKDLCVLLLFDHDETTQKPKE